MSQDCMIFYPNITDLIYLLGNIVQKTQSIPPARKLLLPLSGSLSPIYRGVKELGNRRTVPAHPARGFLNDITSQYISGG
ncbi:hypothetical protein ES703_101265 [subsurface metagenome]